MRLPVIRGYIDRRILVNFRVDSQVVARLLPEPFRPMTVQGFGVAGICLIRLKSVRPRAMVGAMGMSSENCALRIAVEWTEHESVRTGVFICQRYSSSRLNTIFGGRLFPGVHRHARFDVRERDGRYQIAIASPQMQLDLDAEISGCWPTTSSFHSAEDASKFFQDGSLGYSPARRAGVLEGLELRAFNWNLAPLDVRSIRSTFFSDPKQFPPGSAEFDSAFLMQGIDHEWHATRDMHLTAQGSRL